jgi:hypothetical protein
LDLFTLRHRICSFFCFGSLAVDPVGGALNYVIALLLPPILWVVRICSFYCIFGPFPGDFPVRITICIKNMFPFSSLGFFPSAGGGLGALVLKQWFEPKVEKKLKQVVLFFETAFFTLNKNWIVQRPGAIRSEVGPANMKFFPSYLLPQLAITITIKKKSKKLSKSCQKVVKKLSKLSNKCPKVVKIFITPGKNKKRRWWKRRKSSMVQKKKEKWSATHARWRYYVRKIKITTIIFWKNQIMKKNKHNFYCDVVKKLMS